MQQKNIFITALFIGLTTLLPACIWSKKQSNKNNAKTAAIETTIDISDVDVNEYKDCKDCYTCNKDNTQKF